MEKTEGQRSPYSILFMGYGGLCPLIKMGEKNRISGFFLVEENLRENCMFYSGYFPGQFKKKKGTKPKNKDKERETLKLVNNWEGRN